MPTMATAKLPGEGAVPVDAQGRFANDVPCIRCHYNLRGCLADGRCPECGLAAGRSAYGHWLRYCEPTWVANVWVGYNYFAAIPLGAGLMFLVMWLTTQESVVALHSDVIDLLVPAAVFSATVVVGLFGIWRIGTPDPAKVDIEGVMSLRRLTRISPFLVVGNYVALGLIGQTLEPQFAVRLPAWGDTILDAMARCVMLLPLALPVLTLWYGRRLALRVPAPKLARASWIVIVLILFGATGSLAVDFVWQHWQDDIAMWLFYYQNPHLRMVPYMGQPWFFLAQLNRWEERILYTLIGTTIFGLLAMSGVFIGYWRVMRTQAKLARESWAGTAAPSATS